MFLILFLVLLHDSLHLQQYVERVSKVLQFMIEQNVLTNADLNMIWCAKLGVHPAIVSNVDSLLAKIACDLSDSQLDHLFNLFRSAWVAQEASRRDREQLLELVRRLAEDDRKGKY